MRIPRRIVAVLEAKFDEFLAIYGGGIVDKKPSAWLFVCRLERFEAGMEFAFHLEL